MNLRPKTSEGGMDLLPAWMMYFSIIGGNRSSQLLWGGSYARGEQRILVLFHGGVCLRAGRSFETLNPLLFFADVMESINGRRDPLPAAGVKQHICMMVTWLQFPSNTNATYNVHKAEAKGVVERTKKQ